MNSLRIGNEKLDIVSSKLSVKPMQGIIKSMLVYSEVQAMKCQPHVIWSF